jgi:hypothetical protein
MPAMATTTPGTTTALYRLGVLTGTEEHGSIRLSPATKGQIARWRSHIRHRLSHGMASSTLVRSKAHMLETHEGTHAEGTAYLL